MCGVRTKKVSWNASFSGFDAGDFIAAGPVTNDFCFQIRQTWALQRNAPVHTESVNPPAATVNPPAATVHPAGALHAGKERKCSGGKRTSVAAIGKSYMPANAASRIILQARVHLGKVGRLRLCGDETVLDVGCGRGLLLIGVTKLLPRGRAVGRSGTIRTHRGKAHCLPCARPRCSSHRASTSGSSRSRPDNCRAPPGRRYQAAYSKASSHRRDG